MAPPLTIGMFGPMRVLVGGAPLPRLRSRKALWLLALLSLRNGRSIPREWVAGMLWPDSDLSVAFANLRPVICDLRRALGTQAYRLSSPDRATVMFDLENASVDVLAFDTALAKGDFSNAAEIYQGPLLEGCTEEWAPQERSSRELGFARALQVLGDACYEKGDYSEAAEHYGRQIVLDPWRDAPRRGIMRALVKSGDINAALQTYRDFAQTLRSEGALVPDDKTTALYNRVRALAQQGARTVREVEEERPAVKEAGHIPHALTPLVGREDERTELAAKLRQHRLVTLIGMGGIGKTRLALAMAKEVAPKFPDGAWLVSLESLSDEHSLVEHVVSCLGLQELTSQPAIGRLTEWLRHKRVLLVLDSCEHVVRPVASLCAHLLRECGNAVILATSRQSLGVLGEGVWTVPPLAVPDPGGLPKGSATRLRVVESYESVDLFVQRAREVNPNFVLDSDSAPAVAEICSRLEGVPLAIELAAARLNALTVTQVSDRLESALQLLIGGDRSTTPRHRTLRDTLDWSYRLLSPEERRLFAWLAVFNAGWTLEAAESICREGALSGADISRLHGALVDKSLAEFDVNTGRFRFMEPVRQYALEKLEETGDSRETRIRLAAWRLGLAQLSDRGQKSGVYYRRRQHPGDRGVTRSLAHRRNDRDGSSAFALQDVRI